MLGILVSVKSFLTYSFSVSALLNIRERLVASRAEIAVRPLDVWLMAI